MEQIKCPECGSMQKVEMLHDFPFVHTCSNCEYVIMESEWESIKTIKQND